MDHLGYQLPDWVDSGVSCQGHPGAEAGLAIADGGGRVG